MTNFVYYIDLWEDLRVDYIQHPTLKDFRASLRARLQPCFKLFALIGRQEKMETRYRLHDLTTRGRIM